MAKIPVADIRNVAFGGHGAAGKTALLDKILSMTGTVTRPASVDDGTSICDFDEEEKVHHHSVEAHVVHFNHDGKRFYAIDTPGYPDFVGQTIGAVHAVDTVVVEINAQSGIGVTTRRVFNEAGKAGLGRFIAINKMDADNIDFARLVKNIQDMFGKSCQLLNVPLGQGADFRGVASTLKVPADTQGALVDPNEIHTSLIESIIEVDEDVMTRYFDGVEPSDEELARLIVHAVAGGTLIPIVCCSAKTGVGVKELLDALVFCGLPPNAVHRTAVAADGKTVEVAADPDGPLVAQIFKTRIDPFVQKLSFIRIYSGTLKSNETVQAEGIRKGVKLGQLFEIQADKTEPVDSASAGQIVAVTKMEDFKTGMSLGDLLLPHIHFPAPMVGLAITSKGRGDEAKIATALRKVELEDPTFRLHADPQTKEMVAYGMSELHLQLLRERLKRRDKAEVETKEPKIPYRETIQANAEGSYRHKKQSGGRGQFGEVHIRMFPLPKDVNIEEFCTKARFPSMKEYHYDAGEQLRVGQLGRGRHDSQQLPARHRERIQGAHGARRDRRLQGAERRRGGPLRQVSRRRQLGTGLQDGRFDGLPQRLPAGQAGPPGADREDRDHGAQQQGGRHHQRHVGPPRPRAADGLGRRRPANRRGRSAAGRSHDLRPRPLQHHRRPGQLHAGIQPPRHRARQRAAGDHRQGAVEGRGRGVGIR